MSGINSPPNSSVFTILPDQKAKYEVQFKKICPSGDFVSGQQARELMLKSGLPPQVLAHVWNLADVDTDGRMDINEFSIALHLIALKLKGVELPATLPPALKLLVEPPPFAAFNNEPSAASSSSSSSTMQKNAPQAMTKSTSQSTIQQTNSVQKRMGSVGDISMGFGLKKPQPPPATAMATTTTTSAEWAIPQQTKLKYTQLFNQHDRQRTGFLTGIQARNILLESKLPQAILAQIWNLSDVDVDGRLTCEEFVLAMHLVDKAKRGETLPSKLSADLIPPSYRRGSVGVTGTLSHASSLDDTSEHSDGGGNLSKTSFEDKRRENYEKGQAELDRRRAALQEQERRVREERERKEREEQARKEKERLEQERRRQEEIEMQKQKLRLQELEREEQKRRQQEVRELARKEMERQRQQELEKAKRSELLMQRSRLLDEIHKLKTRKKVLVIEHEQIDKCLAESKTMAQQSRDKVVKTKTEIDAMRKRRDELMAKQNQFKLHEKSLTEKQLFVEQEKVRLAAQLKSLIANTSNGVNPDQQLTTFGSILQAKQSQINQLRSQLERMDQEVRAKKEDVLNNKKELDRLKRQFHEKRLEASQYAEKLEAKRLEAEKVRDGKAQSKFASETDVAWGQEVPTNFEWPANMANTEAATTDVTRAKSMVNDMAAVKGAARTKFRYRCVFEFEARNSDEITIRPGDIIMVDTSACSEEGWLSGEINGKIGWFPKDYAVLDEPEESTTTTVRAEPETAAPEAQSSVPGAAVLEAKALYDWSSTEEGHVSFYKDDRIQVTQQQDSWCFGEVLDSTTGKPSGRSGWFPESYVQMLSSCAGGGADAKAAPATTNVSADAAAAADPASQYYVSLYAFETVEPGDLGFDVNELIKVEKRDGDWWTGVIVHRETGEEDPNRKGIFPSNFVGPADPADIPKNATNTVAAAASVSVSANNPIASAADSAAAAATAGVKTHQSLDRKESDSAISLTDSPKPAKKGKSKKPAEIVQAVAVYTATGPEQLSLEINQLIVVRKKTATGWWEGELQAKGKKKQVGWFPASYVKPLGAAGGSAAATTSNPAAAAATSTTTTVVPGKSSASATAAADEPEIERVQALYAFNAQREDEISFEKDDVIRVLNKTDPTWWRGHNVRTGVVGLFPSNHVQTLAATAANPGEPNAAAGKPSDAYNGHDGGDTDDGDNDDDEFEDCSQEIDSFGVAPHHDHSNSNSNEQRRSLDGGQNAQNGHGGDRGYDVVDNCYYDSFSDDDCDDGEEEESYSMRSNNSDNQPMSLSQNQNHWDEKTLRQRMNLFREMVHTEHDYLKDLYFVIENYIDRVRQSNLISQDDCDLFFEHLESIYDANLLLYKDLNQRLQEYDQYDRQHDLCFCDIIIKHLQQMLPIYQEYFGTQVTALNRLQDRIETNQAFEELLKQILIETKSPLPLSSYLIKPMQRITKYPLLMEKIRKCTPAEHPDYPDCSEALKFAKEFCTYMNDACKKTENFDKLKWLQRNIVLPMKSCHHTIVFNSDTRFLGPRLLIRSGLLVKVSSSKLLAAFLFNDFLLLATADRKGLKLHNVTNFFHNKSALSFKYTVYRKPILLSDLRITNISEFEHQMDPGLFRFYIETEKRAITLRANSPRDCNQWLNDIQIARQEYSDAWKRFTRKHLEPNQFNVAANKPIGHIFLTVIEAVNIFTSKPVVDVQCELALGDDWQTKRLTKTFRTSVASSSWGAKSQSLSSTFRSKSISNLNRMSPDSAFLFSSSNSHYHNGFVMPSSSSSSTGMVAEQNSPKKIHWNSDTKFLVTTINTNLLIRLMDVNPFEPDRCLGWAKIPLEQILDQCKSIGGPFVNDVKIQMDNHHNHQPETHLLIKYKMILNAN